MPQTPPAVSDCWDDLTLDTSRIVPQLEEEATELVEKEFERIRQEYDTTILGEARKSFTQQIQSYSGPLKAYKLYNSAEPSPLYLCPFEKVKRFSSTKSLPRMRYWVHTERNFETADSVRLSHIPHIDDELDDREFVTELRHCYTEGIHGADFGCGEYINDYMIYKLLSATMKEWKEDKSYIHAAIFKMFPNKYSFKELEDSIFLTLKERFDPSGSIPIALNKVDNNVQCVNHMLCLVCLEYDCTQHSAASDHILNPAKKSNNFFGTMKTPSTPCSETCFLVYKDGNDVIVPDSELIMTTLKVLLTSNDYEICKIAKVLNSIYTEVDDKPKDCVQWFLLANSLIEGGNIEKASEGKRKKQMKKLSQREKYRVFKRYRSSLDNSCKMRRCKHEGPCHQSDDCPCMNLDLTCTKYCGCDDSCVIKFPGCSCSAGLCATQQCPCFLGRWECDPDLCQSCNCDIENIKKDGAGVILPFCRNVGLQLGLKKNIDIGLSNVAGWGCFIKGTAEKGDLISEYTGEIISSDEAERRGRIYDKKQCSYVFRLNKEQSVDAGRVGNIIRFANHSDTNPNCESQIMIVNGDQRIGIYAKRHIDDGEELFFNYGYQGKNKQYVSLKLSGSAKNKK